MGKATQSGRDWRWALEDGGGLHPGVETGQAQGEWLALAYSAGRGYPRWCGKDDTSQTVTSIPLGTLSCQGHRSPVQRKKTWLSIQTNRYYGIKWNILFKKKTNNPTKHQRKFSVRVGGSRNSPRCQNSSMPTVCTHGSSVVDTECSVLAATLWGNWVTDRLSNFPTVTRRMSNKQNQDANSGTCFDGYKCSSTLSHAGSWCKAKASKGQR